MLWLFAQEGGGGGNGIPSGLTDLVQYGVLGLVVIMFIWGKIVPGYLYDRRVQEHTAEKDETRKLEETIRERIIPALTRSTDVMAQVLEFLNEDAPPRRGRGRLQ